MSTEAVSPLRRRMIEDMTIRQFGEHTKKDYIRQVREFAAFLGRSPDRAEPEDLRRYQLHLASLGASYSRMNLASTALRFFFHTTLGRPGFGDRMARIPTPERLPVVLSPEEVALLLAHAPNLKYRAALSVAYGCGLRILDRLTALHEGGRLAFFGEQAGLADRDAFSAHLAPLRKAEWVVYAKRPFGGPEAVLAYLSRYTHRVAISNSRLIAHDERGVTFRWKDYRARDGAKGREWIKTMTLGAEEFIRRFLLHVLPDGFHRIRHYGLFATSQCKANVARVRSLLAPAQKPIRAEPEPATDAGTATPACPCCGGRLVIIKRFRRRETPRARPTAIRIDTS